MQKARRPQGSPLLYYITPGCLSYVYCRHVSMVRISVTRLFYRLTFLLPELSCKEITPCLDWLHLLFDH